MNLNTKIAVISVCGTLAGTIIGGAITALVTHLQSRNQIKQQKKSFLIEKYEKLHEYLSIVIHELNIISTRELTGLLNDMQQISEISKKRIPINEVRMIIDFYIPELEKEKEKLDTCWKNVGEVLAKIVLKKPFAGKERNDTIAQLVVASTNTQKTADEIKNKLAKLIKKIT